MGNVGLLLVGVVLFVNGLVSVGVVSPRSAAAVEPLRGGRAGVAADVDPGHRGREPRGHQRRLAQLSVRLHLSVVRPDPDL
ncbi:AmiS/UreI family transporter [Mycolicibacterium thermoresistibile]|uniref:AmiS/UreI family transporter n=1 Tax=Mycolicibacterium thermoresistibile TaxID=1797 RepID=UPI003F49AF98